MISMVVEQTLKSKVDYVIVATDDDKIIKAVEQHNKANQNGRVFAFMTSKSHISGTDRMVEALQIFRKQSIIPDVVVNVQGDEPLISPDHIDLVINNLKTNNKNINNDFVMSTIAVQISDMKEVSDENNVKVVMDRFGSALYFSRAVIPHIRSGNNDKIVQYHRHIGLYCYKTQFLMNTFPNLPYSSLENAESLEQLRVLQAGYKIHVDVVKHAHKSVDTRDDYEMIKSYLLQSKYQ